MSSTHDCWQPPLARMRKIDVPARMRKIEVRERMRGRAASALLLCMAFLAAPAQARGIAAQPRHPIPLNGIYQMSGLRLCSGSAPAAPNTPPAPTLIRAETAQLGFTPASKQPFAEWVTEITSAADPASEPPGWQAGTAMLANTPNPIIADAQLSEIAVEWGQIDLANFRTEIGAPGAAANETHSSGPTWFFITEYSYGDDVVLDTFTTGYAVYVWRDETDGWLRYVMNLNSRLTFTAAAASGHAAYRQQIEGVAYNCVRQVQLHQ